MKKDTKKEKMFFSSVMILLNGDYADLAKLSTVEHYFCKLFNAFHFQNRKFHRSLLKREFR